MIRREFVTRLAGLCALIPFVGGRQAEATIVPEGPGGDPLGTEPVTDTTERWLPDGANVGPLMLPCAAPEWIPAPSAAVVRHILLCELEEVNVWPIGNHRFLAPLLPLFDLNCQGDRLYFVCSPQFSQTAEDVIADLQRVVEGLRLAKLTGEIVWGYPWKQHRWPPLGEYGGTRPAAGARLAWRELAEHWQELGRKLIASTMNSTTPVGEKYPFRSEASTSQELALVAFEPLR